MVAMVVMSRVKVALILLCQVVHAPVQGFTMLNSLEVVHCQDLLAAVADSLLKLRLVLPLH